MRAPSPLVLTANVSAVDRQWIAKTFEDAGFDVLGVEAAKDVDAHLARHRRRCVLVIDSGLLGMPHDDQWRLLRTRHPDLGAVVRCWIGKEPGMRRTEERTFLVHPDDGGGLLLAARALGSIPHRISDPARLGSGRVMSTRAPTG